MAIIIDFKKRNNTKKIALMNGSTFSFIEEPQDKIQGGNNPFSFAAFNLGIELNDMKNFQDSCYEE